MGCISLTCPRYDLCMVAADFSSSSKDYAFSGSGSTDSSGHFTGNFKCGPFGGYALFEPRIGVKPSDLAPKVRGVFLARGNGESYFIVCEKAYTLEELMGLYGKPLDCLIAVAEEDREVEYPKDFSRCALNLENFLYIQEFKDRPIVLPNRQPHPPKTCKRCGTTANYVKLLNGYYCTKCWSFEPCT